MKLIQLITSTFFIFTLMACQQVTIDEDAIMYQNPVFEPVLADPSILRAEDGYFYAYGTEDAWNHSADFRYIPIVRSSNLIDWEYVGDAFQEKPDWKGFAYIWAPDIQFINGQYYLYYSLSVWGDSNPAIGVAVSDSPAGPFTDMGKLFDSEEIGVDNSIDPHVHITEDGELWMFWGSFRGIYAIELTEDGLDYVGEKTHIAGNAFEASFIVLKDEFYYLFLSTGSCCSGANSSYEVKIARSESLLGPYVDRRGRSILGSSGSLVVGDGEDYVGNGHNSVVQDDAGDYWLIYHGINKDDPYLPNGATRRPLMIDKIIWDRDGWPQLDSFRPSETETIAPYIVEE